MSGNYEKTNIRSCFPCSTHCEKLKTQTVNIVISYNPRTIQHAWISLTHIGSNRKQDMYNMVSNHAINSVEGLFDLCHIRTPYPNAKRRRAFQPHSTPILEQLILRLVNVFFAFIQDAAPCRFLCLVVSTCTV